MKVPEITHLNRLNDVFFNLILQEVSRLFRR